MNNKNFQLRDIDNFNVLQSIARGQHDFSVFNLNVQRICDRKKFQNFSSYIDLFANKPLLMGITETWFLRGETGEVEDIRLPIRLYGLEGYKSTFSSRAVHTGGIALYVRDDIAFETISKSNGDVSFIHGAATLTNNGVEERVYVTHVYMPRVSDYENLLRILEVLFISVPRGMRHILMGDFNIDVTKSHKESLAYLDLLTSYGYSVTNEKITRPRTNSIIDHFVTNFSGVTNYTIANDLSDHNGILSTVDLTFSSRENQTTTNQKSFVNLRQLQDSLRSSFADLSIFNGIGADDALSRLIQILNKAVESSSRVSNPCKYKSGSKAWIDPEIIRLSKQKRQLLRRLKDRPYDTQLKMRLKELNHDIAYKKRLAKSKYIREQFVRGVSDSKTCWKALNRVLGRSVNNVVPDRLVINGTRVVSGAQSVAEELNRAFVGCDLSVPQISQSFAQTDPPWCNASMMLIDVYDVEVESLLNKLNVHKSTGYDGISTYVLKNCAGVLAKPLALCINKVLEEGTYPDFLKIARVTPIFKGGSKELASNYRPISVLTALNKVYESVLAERLKSFFKSQKLVYDHQYGFREKSGTATAAIEVMDFVLGNLDKRGYSVVSALFIDLRKAFDSVNHEILLRKLYVYGVRGPALGILRSYLTGRRQFVSVSGEASSWRNVSKGVPQGSVLGPLLFLMFLNDIAQLPLFGKIFLYADDACLMYPGTDDSSNCTKMNEDLELLSQYFSRNDLQLNVSKTKYMHLCSSRKLLSGLSRVTYRGELVEEVQEFCYLGLWLDSNLTWKRHVHYLCSKLSQLVGIFYRVRDEIPLYALKRLYYALAHSRLTYMITVWANTTGENLERIQVLQNRLLKLIFRLPVLTETMRVYKESEMLPVKGIHVYATCRFMRQSLTNATYHTLPFSVRPGIRHLRDPGKITSTQPKTGWGKLRFSYIGPTLYNLLPKQLRDSNTDSIFLRDTRKYLLHDDSLRLLVKGKWYDQ